MTLIRRVVAAVGLVLLVPVAIGLLTGRTALWDAGLRAVAVLAVAVVLQRLLPRLVMAFADTLDGTWRGEPVPADRPAPDG